MIVELLLEFSIHQHVGQPLQREQDKQQQVVQELDLQALLEVLRYYENVDQVEDADYEDDNEPGDHASEGIHKGFELQGCLQVLEQLSGVSEPINVMKLIDHVFEGPRIVPAANTVVEEELEGDRVFIGDVRYGLHNAFKQSTTQNNLQINNNEDPCTAFRRAGSLSSSEDVPQLRQHRRHTHQSVLVPGAGRCRRLHQEGGAEQGHWRPQRQAGLRQPHGKQWEQLGSLWRTWQSLGRRQSGAEFRAWGIGKSRQFIWWTATAAPAAAGWWIAWKFGQSGEFGKCREFGLWALRWQRKSSQAAGRRMIMSIFWICFTIQQA